MIEPAFRIRLVTDTAVAAIVGDRVYFNVRAEDETRPCIVLTSVSRICTRTYEGKVAAITARMQCDCFASDYQTAKTLGAAVRARLDKYSGTLEAIKFHWIEIEDERDVPSAPLKGQAVPLYGVSIDARCFAEEVN